ncbi:MAG TPA: amino acid adenylation domain-containing protein, partial [Chitinophaga sp.]
MNEHREYWHSKLAGELPVLDFPTEFARTPEKRYNGKYYSHELDTYTSGQFRKLAREGEASLFITFLALVKVLVYRYTGQQDFILGTSVTGRNHPELESQVGLYLNTLLFRDTITGEDSFEQVLGKVRQTVTAAYTHQMYPFNRLVDELKVARDPSRHPVIDIMVDQHKHEQQEQERDEDELKVDSYTREAYFNKMDLVFNIVETEGPLVLGLGYNTDLFSEPYAQRICMHLERLLKGIIAAPDRSIRYLDLLTDSEREYILHDLNPLREEVKDTRSIKEQFEFQAAAAPESVCIREGSRDYSYGEVDALSNRLAHYLQAECGVMAGERVGVLQDRSAWLVISMLAVMKAGGVYVPVDTSYPGSRKEFIFSDACVRVVLTVSEQLFSLSEYYRGAIFVVDSQAGELLSQSSAPLSTVLSASSPAYIIYTSGSTGQPKGVLVSCGALQNLCSWHCSAFGVTASSRATLYAGVGFDASLWEVWPYLLSGAALYPFTESDRLELLTIRSVLEEEGITHCFLPTPVCEQLGHIDCEGLILLTGGDRLQEVPGGNVRLVNNYGPTEGTVVSTSVFLEGAMKGAVPIGRPILNTEAYVLDDDGGLVPVGITGELYISGAHLSSGYINNVTLTRERFVPHLYRNGEQMYATGDLCRWGTDGQLYFMGRKDSQVKVRGYRIEPGEIEQQLLSYSGITQAYVLLRERANGEGVLVAYYTGSGNLGRQSLRSYLQGRLPSYMVPSCYVYLEEVPLTANGKVDRSVFELPDDFELQGPGEEKAGARTREEEVLLGIWQELLGHDHIGIRDNFFEIGGHSLKAVQMITRIYEKLQVAVKMNTVFMHPTIEQLAEELDHYEKTDFERIQPLPPQEHYAISHAQKRLWILSQVEEKHVAHNMSEAYDLKGALNIHAFRKAMLSMIERHESLRTTIRIFEGEPRQVIHDTRTMEEVFCYLDLCNSIEGEAS